MIGVTDKTIFGFLYRKITFDVDVYAFLNKEKCNIFMSP